MVDIAASTFAALLKQYRAAAALTQEELAERAGLSGRTISDLERGIKHHPYPHTVQRLIQALGLPDDEASRFHQAARHLERPEERPKQDSQGDRQRFTLPVQPTPFIGRLQEVDEVSALLHREAVRLLTLTGPGGVGKTRLALDVAHEAQDVFPDGVCFVSLAPLADPALVPAAIARSLQVNEVSGESILERLIEYLQEKQLLLLLDNFEHLIPAAYVVSSLLAACPQVTVLVTSRVILHLAAEHEYPVPPLATPVASHLQEVDALSRYDAIQLFLQRAQAARSGFRLTEENAPMVAEICSRLDGLPLAIELAAARIRLFSPKALLARLSDPLQLLTGGPRDVPARQQTLGQTIEWSYRLLTPAEQRLLARLSAFAGGCSLAAAEAVCNPEGELNVLAGTTALVEHSLLRSEGEDEPRLWMLETIREYCLERLKASGEALLARERHARYFLEVAEAVEHAYAADEQTDHNRSIGTALLQGDYDNLRAALSWSLEQEDTADLALRLVAALAWFWIERRDLNEGRRWIERALAFSAPSQAGGTHNRARAQAVAGMATLTVWQGDHAAARAYAEQAVKLWQGLGDQRETAFALRRLGQVATHQGDHALAASLLTEAAERFRSLGNITAAVRALGRLGGVEMRRGQLAAAQSRLEEALALAQQAGNTDEILFIYCALAELAWVQGKKEAAHRHYDEATALLVTCQDARDRAQRLDSLAWVAYHLGDYEEATALYAESLTLVQAQPESAERSQRIAWLLNHLGDMARCQGKYARAAEVYEESLVLFRRQEERQGSAAVLHNLGHVALAEGNLVRARALFEQSLSLFNELGFAWSIADCVAGLACVAAREGQPERAARLFGAAEAVHTALDASGRLNEPANRLSWDREMARARRQLNDEEFLLAWEAGSAMSLEEAVANALGKGK